MTNPVFDYGDVSAEQSRALADFLTFSAGQSVTLIINSPGGAAMIGAADAAAVEAHGEVTAIGRGIVASAATLPFVAAKTPILHGAALFMVHDPSTSAAGTAAQLRGTAYALESIAATYAEYYAKKTRLPRARIVEMMAAETWLAPADAVAMGFADLLETAAGELPAVACFDPSIFKHPPAILLDALAKAKGNTMTEQTPINSETAAPAQVEMTAAERKRASRIAHRGYRGRGETAYHNGGGTDRIRRND